MKHAYVQFATETFLYQQMQTVFQRVHPDVVDNFVHESEHQKQTSFLQADTTLPRTV